MPVVAHMHVFLPLPTSCIGWPHPPRGGDAIVVALRRAALVFRRMALTESLNGAHGPIHELLGGSWSMEANAFAKRTSSIVQPFVHQIAVSSRDGKDSDIGDDGGACGGRCGSGVVLVTAAVSIVYYI